MPENRASYANAFIGVPGVFEQHPVHVIFHTVQFAIAGFLFALCVYLTCAYADGCVLYIIIPVAVVCLISILCPAAGGYLVKQVVLSAGLCGVGICIVEVLLPIILLYAVVTNWPSDVLSGVGNFAAFTCLVLLVLCNIGVISGYWYLRSPLWPATRALLDKSKQLKKEKPPPPKEKDPYAERVNKQAYSDFGDEEAGFSVANPYMAPPMGGATASYTTEQNEFPSSYAYGGAGGDDNDNPFYG